MNTEELSSVVRWFHPILAVSEDGWRLVPRRDHVTPGLFRLLIRREVTAADGRGMASSLPGAS